MNRVSENLHNNCILFYNFCTNFHLTLFWSWNILKCLNSRLLLLLQGLLISLPIFYDQIIFFYVFEREPDNMGSMYSFFSSARNHSCDLSKVKVLCYWFGDLFSESQIFYSESTHIICDWKYMKKNLRRFFFKFFFSCLLYY